jgi:hypothetical protein
MALLGTKLGRAIRLIWSIKGHFRTYQIWAIRSYKGRNDKILFLIDKPTDLSFTFQTA